MGTADADGGRPGRRAGGLGLFVFLYLSLCLNALAFAHYYLVVSRTRLIGSVDDGGCTCGLTWALKAAREAEATAAADCSGHGQAFLDGEPGEDGRPGCECNACFAGPDCSVRTPNCTADANSGDPVFLAPYWRRHAAASAVVVSGWHRLSYDGPDGLTQSVELEKHIRRLHGAVGNAVVDDKYLVFGTGSTQLINALVHALSSSPDGDNASASPPTTASVVATVPYYPPYRSQTTMFDGRRYEWDGSTAAVNNASSNSTTTTTTSKRFVEFVTSPNNPDTLLRGPVLTGSSAIVDRAYYWPHFTHIPAPADDDVMLFTMSKPSGHAGSRLGWALIRDAKVAKRAYDYVDKSTMGTSRDTQLRMLGILKAMLASLRGQDDIFAFGHDVMRSRWRRLNAVVSRSRRISLQKVTPQFCSYFNRTREPSPAYAWVKCGREEDQDCYQALVKAKIITRSGVGNEAGRRYTRVSLLKSDDDFDVLLERVTDLVNAEQQQYDAAPDASSM